MLNRGKFKEAVARITVHNSHSEHQPEHNAKKHIYKTTQTGGPQSDLPWTPKPASLEDLPDPLWGLASSFRKLKGNMQTSPAYFVPSAHSHTAGLPVWHGEIPAMSSSKVVENGGHHIPPIA